MTDLEYDDLPTVQGGGDLAPYSPSQPLAPSPDNWGLVPDADYLTERSGGQLQIFGELMPPGTTPQQVEQAIGEIAGLFMGDMLRLGHPAKVINAAIEWYRQAAIAPPRQDSARHRYNLFNEQNDPMANSFGNAMTKVGATQEFVTSALWFLNELNKRVGSHDAMGGANDSKGFDGEWDRLVAKSELDRQQGLYELQRRWGNEFHVKMRVVQNYFGNLPERDREYFENALLPGDVVALNSPDVIEKLYFQAIGGHSLPQGSALQTEIAQIEFLIRTNRRAYNDDEALQARYRHLLTLRDGDL